MPDQLPVTTGTHPRTTDPEALLTTAQMEFARVLGRLLAELWDHKDNPPDRPPPDRTSVP
jgi:hypothetical protein